MLVSHLDARDVSPRWAPAKSHIQTHTEDVDPADMQRRAADKENVEAMA
jgi:hypothetical protein